MQPVAVPHTGLLQYGEIQPAFYGLFIDGPQRRKRMKFNKLSQLLLVSGAGLLVATLLTACQLVTIDYLYIAGTASKTSSGGGIQVLAVDSQSGALRFAAGTDKAAIDTGGASPVAMATTADFANLYVANADNNTVVHFAVTSTGALTMKEKATLSGPPTALAVTQGGSALYVVSGTTTATLTEYPLAAGVIGTPSAQQSLTIPVFA